MHVKKGFLIAKRVILCFIGISFAWVVVHTLAITYDGLKDNIADTDVAVVLGNKVDLDGTPSNRLKSRLDKAVELYEKEYFKYIIVSGGLGKEGYSEAVVMEQYLINKGIPEQCILLDQEGYNTFHTARNTKMIMKNNGFTSVTIISQFYHISRTELAFTKVGVEQVYSAHAAYFELRDIYSLAREFVAYYKYLLM